MIDIKKIAQPVLVTGANGFIGRRVVAKLIESGVSVRALDLPAAKVPEEWRGRVEVIYGDITGRDTVAGAMRGAGTVIHLAAIVGAWGEEKKFQDTAVLGSANIFEEAVRNRSRAVLVSSIVVYGDRIYKGPCPEETGHGKPQGPYSRAKQAQENLANEFEKNRGMKLTVVRPANVYGPGSAMWLHNVIEALQSGRPSLIGGGDFNAGLAYVDNVADIIILAGTDPAAVGRTYNACDGLEVTWRRYLTDIARMADTKLPRSIPRPLVSFAAIITEAVWRAFHIKKNLTGTKEALNLVGSDNRFPIDRVRKELGYEPAVGYEEGMRAVRESFSSSGK